MTQKTNNWSWQWNRFFKDESFIQQDLNLFEQWIYPNTLASFQDKTIVDCGCGRGQHIAFVAPYAKHITGIDQNTAAIATRYITDPKVIIIEGDLATIRLPQKFDVVHAIGVLHHTDNPTNSFNNIKRLLNPGGRMIVWVYSYEGNFLNRIFLEPCNCLITRHINRRILLALSWIITILMYMPIYTLYLLPFRFLPFYQYFRNFRTLTLNRNVLNVFDKLNAPQTQFIPRSLIEKWFNPDEFDDIHISPYVGVSWRASGTLKPVGVSK